MKAKDREGTPDCVTKALIENMVDGAKDPVYMERIVKSAVGSMYLGTVLDFPSNCHAIN